MGCCGGKKADAVEPVAEPVQPPPPPVEQPKDLGAAAKADKPPEQPKAPEPPAVPQRPPEDDGINALLDAAEKGDVAQVLAAVKKDPKMLDRRPDYRDYNALQQMAASGNQEGVEKLLKLRPKLDAKSKDGKTAAQVAEAKGHAKLAGMLKEAEKDGDVNDLLDHAERGDVQKLIVAAKKAPGVLNRRPEYHEFTALQHLAAAGHQEGVEELLALRADPSVKSKDGRTAAQVAEAAGHVELAEMLRKSEQETDINDFLDMAERGSAGAVLDVAKRNPNLLGARPHYRGFTAVQFLAALGHKEAVAGLLSLDPDLSVLSKDGRSASEVAATNGHAELAGVLKRAEQGKRLLREEARGRGSKRGRKIDKEKDIEETKPPRSFIGNYVRAVMFAPLIGKRAPWDKKPVTSATGKVVAEGLRKESRKRTEVGQDGALKVHVNAPPAYCNTDYDGKLDLATEFEACSAEALPKHAIWTFTTESFVDGAVYQAMRDCDDSREGLAPFIKLLDDALVENKGELVYFDGPCYRVRRMSPELAAHYEPCEPPDADSKALERDPTHEQKNVFAWDGFTTCCCDADVAYEQYQALKADTLVIITPRTAAERPIDLRHLSDWGDYDAQVVFPINQQFNKKSVTTRPCAEVWKELGVDAGSTDVGDMRVIKCESIDAFYEFGAEIVYDGSEEAEAVELLRSRIQLEKERYGAESENTLVAMRCLGKAFRLLRRYDEAVQALQPEMEITLRVFGPDSPHAAKSYQSMGTALMGVGQSERSLELLQKAINIRNEKGDMFGDNNKEHIAQCFSNMGLVMVRQQKFEEAMEYTQKALDIRLEASGEQHPDTAASYFNIAECLRMMGRSEQALTYQEKGIAVRKEILGPHDAAVADGLTNMALALTNIDRKEEAMDAFQEAIKIVEQQPGGHRSEKAGMIWNGMGFLEQQRKNWEKAVEHFEHALDIWTERLGPAHPNTEYASQQLKVTKDKLRKHNKRKALHEQHEREREAKRLAGEMDETDDP